MRRELLAEDGHAEKDRRHGLQRPENRRGRRADVLDGARGAEERDGCREDGQRQQVAPQIPLARERDGRTEVEPHQEERQTEKQHIEGHLEGRELAERGSVDPDDVDGIGERRGHDEQRARKAQRRAVARAVEQADARECQQDAEGGLQRELLVEAHGHDERHHDGIDEEQRRCDAGVHVVVAQEERERGERQQQTQQHERHYLAAAEAEVAPPAEAEHGPQQRNGEQIAEKEHRIGVHALLVERKGKEGIHAVGGGGDRTQQITFGFGIHASLDFGAKIAFISPHRIFFPKNRAARTGTGKRRAEPAEGTGERRTMAEGTGEKHSAARTFRRADGPPRIPSPRRRAAPKRRTEGERHTPPEYAAPEPCSSRGSDMGRTWGIRGAAPTKKGATTGSSDCRPSGFGDGLRPKHPAPAQIFAP